MLFGRRCSSLAFGFLIAGSLLGQSEETIPNWSAPPYWMPQKTFAKAEPEVPGGLAPEAAEGGPAGPLAFTAITPCRIVDTRGNGFTGGYGPPALTQGVPRDFVLGGRCGIPSGSVARAISLNITVTNTQGPGHVLIYPKDANQPTVSTLNYVAGQTVANAAVIQLNADTATVVAGVSGTDLIIDTNGYYAPQTVVHSLNGLSSALQLLAGTNISITPAGQTLTIANTAPAGWSLTGNSGTTPGTHFVGTTDAQALELKVNGERALRVEPDPFPGTYGPNLIGGFLGNSVTAGRVGGVIGGGGQAGLTNRVTGDFGTVGGGWNNEAAGYAAVVAGGRGNTAGGNQATLGAGQDNSASGDFATVPGGANNSAGGTYSFAAGRRAKASHTGTFVWGDSTNSDVSSTSSNQFIARATGGFAFVPAPGVACGLTDVTGWQCASVSDRGVKESVAPVDGRATLERLIELPIHLWSYKGQGTGVRHLGPMAQDFAAAYGLGADDKTINPLDANGVALAAIQALYDLVREKDVEIDALKMRLSKLEEKVE